MSKVATSTQTSLTKEQKQAIGILSIGTFLEYFDLMLYVHMAVLLNELFFPKTDPFTTSLIAAFSFWSTYLLRPVGALLFGYIGDNIGRKQTIVITTFMMALSSFTMFLLPTYAQIGITATWLVTICRMVQGVSSLGEFVGAQLYIAELIKAPRRYFAVATIVQFTTLGTFAALGVATLILKYSLNWRYVFLFGAGIALIGSVARTALRETPEFLEAKKNKLALKKLNIDTIQCAKINKKTAIAYFFLELGNPIWIYTTYIYFGLLLKQQLAYTATDVIEHNFYLSGLSLVVGITMLYLVSKFHPMFIMRMRMVLFLLLAPFFIWNLAQEINILNITLLQCCIQVFHPTLTPGHGIIFSHFPILKRFTTVSMLYALSRIIMYGCSSLGVIYATKYCGMYGLLVCFAPVVICYAYGLNTFINLEKAAGNY